MDAQTYEEIMLLNPITYYMLPPWDIQVYDRDRQRCRD
jgi:hypothetical protein